MAGNDRDKSPASRIIRDRAMAVLRETRAKIDPRLLDAMRDHLTGAMAAGGVKGESAAKPATTATTAQTVFPSRKFEDEVPQAAKTEAVDRQKIAQIVTQYMKNREDLQKH